MIFIVAIVLVVVAVIALRRGDRLWAALLVVALVPTMLTWFGFILALVLVLLYAARLGVTHEGEAVSARHKHTGA